MTWLHRDFVTALIYLSLLTLVEKTLGPVAFMFLLFFTILLGFAHTMAQTLKVYFDEIILL